MPAIDKVDQNEPLSFEAMLLAIDQQFERKDNCVDIDEIWRVLESYQTSPHDWSKFAFYDDHRYKRNLVSEHEKYNVMILCWAPNVISSIHDHSGSHCFMKVLDGRLTESRFAWPDDSITSKKIDDVNYCKSMNLISKSNLELDDILYINDKVGLHCVQNSSKTETAVSLHIYIPPFRKCRTFDERTGQSRECTLNFYSKKGKIIGEDDQTC